MSVYGTILNQVRDGIIGLNQSGMTVVRRKKFEVHERDVLPITVICSMQESEDEEGGFEESLWMNYPVFVGIATATGAQLQNGQDAMLQFRQDDRRLLRAASFLVMDEETVKVRADLDPTFDKPANRDNIDVSGMVITYTVNESRNV